jgi:Cellulase (glycosyl hydrolase family 5)
LLLLACALLVLCAGSASAAPRMYLGFLDDQSFRWLPDRTTSFELARQSNASVVRTIVRWYDVAPVRPADATDAGDPAYDFRDVDEFVRNAQQRGLEVLLTVWGTPGWANGGRAPNVAPANARDLQDFATALADRYSGRHPGYPFARFFAIWNEPNSPRFLASPDAAAAYARIAAAGVAGVKAGSPQALVALGETASRHAPAAFVDAVAKANPRLRFDAWAHHPYPPNAGQSPDAPARWPDVGLGEVARFGDELDRVFHRRQTRVWLTEYAESTSRSVDAQRQAADVSRAVTLAARVPRVDMFVWMMLRNHPGEPWQSGLAGRPALDRFRGAALALDPRNALVPIASGQGSYVLHVPALELKWHIPVAEPVGVKLRLGSCATTSVAAKMEPDGWVPVPLSLRATPGARYRLDVQIQDVHGVSVHRTIELVASGIGTRSTAGADPYC